MRRFRPLLVGPLLVGACIAACSSFDGTTPSEDGGADAPFDAGFDQSASDTSVDVPDGGTDAAVANDGAPPGMVLVALGASKPFWIDREEVTVEAYASFVGVDGGFNTIPGCDFKAGIGAGPFTDCLNGSPTPAADEPIRCIDWCDAFAYCRFRGKRLCGKVGGGTSTFTDESVAAKSEWSQACAASNISADRFPYADGGVDQHICNTDGESLGRPAAISKYPKCTGATPGLHDMSGNVQEWVDACNGSANFGNDQCVVRGGGYNEQPRSCSFADERTRGDRRPFIGVRCCRDVP